MLAAQFSPGPDMLLLLKNAVSHPLRAGLCTVAGIAAGLTVHTTVALTGLAVLLRGSATLTRGLFLAASLYLAWLSFQLLRSVAQARTADGGPAVSTGEIPLSAPAAFMQGLITNLLNPKAALFLLSVMASFAGPDSTTGEKLALAGIILGQAIVFWSLFVWLLKRPPVRRLYLRSERPINLVFGLALAILAVSTFLNVWSNSSR